MKRARSPLLSLAGVVLLGTVLLWAGTRGTKYSWGTKSLPGEHGLSFWAGGGRIGFDYFTLSWYSDLGILQEGFASSPVDPWYQEDVDKDPTYRCFVASTGWVRAYCPTLFPGTLLGGLLLGWGLLCRREGE